MHNHDFKDPRRDLKPETAVLNTGYDDRLSELSIRPPVFLTSTFGFRNAAEGAMHFQRAYHLPGNDGADPGLIYARINNPNIEMLEHKMTAVEAGANFAAAFPSGMSAITTAMLALLPWDATVLYTDPVYGGTYFFLEHLGARFGIKATAVDTSDLAKVATALRAAPKPFDLVLIETPANPTMTLTDIEGVVNLVKEYDDKTLVMVDNTFLGPVFQQPFNLGADIVVYSATKFIGGHSDLIAGIVLTRTKAHMTPIKDYRSILGATVSPFAAWQMIRSLDTLFMRMRQQAVHATKVAEALAVHPKVARVIFPALLKAKDGAAYATYYKQCSGPGSTMSFVLKQDDWESAQRLLDSLELCHLAVSLGGVETLIEHPRRMTHSDMSEADLDRCGISDGMIRLSVGLEDPSDLIKDLYKGLEKV